MTNFGEVGFAGYGFLFLFCILLPIAAVRSAQKLGSRPYPPRLRFYLSVVPQHLFFIVVSSAAAFREYIPLHFESFDIRRSVIVSTLLLAVMVPAMYTRWRNAVIKRERRAYLFMPNGPREKALWLLLAVLAGIGEELTYRGVMWILLARLMGTYWGAALLASAVFAVSHYLQGWRSMAVIAVFAMIFHWLVWYTGSLIEAIAVHAVYDLIAGMAYSYLGSKHGYPQESPA